MMDKNKKDRLQSLTNVTVNTLHDKLSPMINSLITHNLVANTIDDELNAYPTRMEKARELHCRVIRGGKSAYELYYLCLRECGIDDIADRMEDLVDKSVFLEKDVPTSPLLCDQPTSPMLCDQPTSPMPVETNEDDTTSEENLPEDLDIMMPQHKRDRLQSLTIEAANAWHDKLHMMINYFITYKLVDNTIDDELKAYSTRMDKARELHTCITRGGKSAYEVYYHCLRECGVDDIADEMEDLIDKSLFPEEIAVHYQSESTNPIPMNEDAETLEEKMPEVWPLTDEPVYELPLRKFESQDDTYFENLQNDIKMGLVYSLPHGLALIINNRNFRETSYLRTRSNTDKDASLLCDTLTDIGFQVVEKKDCTAKEIISNITASALKTESRPCFICIIMSHGEAGYVYGVDGQLMSIKNIVKSSDRLNLIDSPKLFFIEACQGVIDDGRDVESSTGASGDSTQKEHPDVDFDLNDPTSLLSVGGDTVMESASVAISEVEITNSLSGGGDTVMERYSVACSEVEDSKKHLEFVDIIREHQEGDCKRPSLLDVFIGTATIEGYVAWAHDINESWFIQALVYVLKKWSYKDSLDNLFTKVCKLISMQSHRDYDYKLLPNKISTLTKKFYFLPGVSEEDIAEVPTSTPYTMMLPFASDFT